VTNIAEARVGGSRASPAVMPHHMLHYQAPRGADPHRGSMPWLACAAIDMAADARFTRDAI